MITQKLRYILTKKYTEENQSEQKIFYKKKIVEAVEKIEDVNILIKIFDFIKVWIKSIRESTGLTQEEFGKRIGAARNTIANYETGNRNPSNTAINSICREFNITEKWLRTGEEPKYAIINDDYK